MNIHDEDFKPDFNEFDLAKEELPHIEFCLNCGSLHLVETDLGDVLCKSCGSENYVGICSDIDEYLDRKEKGKLI